MPFLRLILHAPSLLRVSVKIEAALANKLPADRYAAELYQVLAKIRPRKWQQRAEAALREWR